MGAAKKTSGFFIIEILIVLVIIGILVTALTPNFISYSRRANFVDNLTAADALKSAVAACIIQNGAATSCNGGVSGIPANIASGYGGNVNSLSVSSGVITATSTTANFGGVAYTYILTPAIVSGSNAVTWTASGTCQAVGYC